MCKRPFVKPKLLCILHRSPPFHGAAKVGDFVASSQQLHNAFDCRFITIKSSDSIEDIGKINIKKIYLFAALYFKVLWALLTFRPQKVYFTASVDGAAFFRDVIISTLWKTLQRFKSVDVFYHYHTKGISEFIGSSSLKLALTRFFLKNVNLVLLTPMLEQDFSSVRTFKKIYYLPNGIENTLSDTAFDKLVSEKYPLTGPLQVLYLSNMIKSKGYFEVLKLAERTKHMDIHFNFAGGWQSTEDEKEFFNYIAEHDLEKCVTFHGFVNGERKKALWEQSHLMLFPTRYKAESFGLVIIEAFSYGIPVIATDEGSIPSIIDQNNGVIIDDLEKLYDAFTQAQHALITAETSRYCRKHFLENYTLEQFEKRLVTLLSQT